MVNNAKLGFGVPRITEPQLAKLPENITAIYTLEVFGVIIRL
ncbi:MAG: hypothetical protein O3C20_02930 [Verrucomicrobia bacterium]|nr:hypothetical protein [Verrucomicrobiota bacterium]